MRAVLYNRCEEANREGTHFYLHHLEVMYEKLLEAVAHAGLTIVPDDSPDVYKFDCEVPLRLDPKNETTIQSKMV